MTFRSEKKLTYKIIQVKLFKMWKVQLISCLSNSGWKSEFKSDILIIKTTGTHGGPRLIINL
ncbi:MAG: hypothetical protein CVV23_14685 [Ignavibacteriae bacterium HGW-Ignavibacteriae-2]|jgi:hypothetical protein|nr:MAG: hypothetical protein CVV23_14685 [Ignavibacteriae bacterium HGW-Ignavibacteriae-2]